MAIVEFVTAHVTVIVSGAGVAVAIWLGLRQLRYQRKLAAQRAASERKLAAQRAALDFISKFEVHNLRWTELCSEFVSLKSSNRLGSLVNPTKEELEESDPEKRTLLQVERERNRILVCSYLNHFECVGVAIHHGIIDEDFYKEWLRRDYIQAWNDAHSFVIELRKREGMENPKLFVQLQELAEKWDKEN